MAPGPEIPCYMPRHHPRPRNIVRSLLRQTHTADVPVSLQDLPAYRAPHEIWMKGKSSDIISSELNVPLNFKYMRWQASLYSTWDCRRFASSSNATRILTSPRSSWKMPSMQLLGCYPLAITIFPMTSLAFVLRRVQPPRQKTMSCENEEPKTTISAELNAQVRSGAFRQTQSRGYGTDIDDE